MASLLYSRSLHAQSFGVLDPWLVLQLPQVPPLIEWGDPDVPRGEFWSGGCVPSSGMILSRRALRWSSPALTLSAWALEGHVRRSKRMEMMILGSADEALGDHRPILQRCDNEQAKGQGSVRAGECLWNAPPLVLDCSPVLGCPYPVALCLWFWLCLFVFL